jgi:hypothetical protein
MGSMQVLGQQLHAACAWKRPGTAAVVMEHLCFKGITISCVQLTSRISRARDLLAVASDPQASVGGSAVVVCNSLDSRWAAQPLNSTSDLVC